MPKKERQSNIELLRILAIIGVIVLHYNNPQIGRGLAYANREGARINLYVLYFLESVFVCAVDLFMLISGYFMCDLRKRNLWRPIELIVQVILFREAIYLGKVCFTSTAFSLKTAVSTLIPANYFVILYCVVFLVSPWVNVAIDKISEKSFRVLIILLMLLFSVYPTFVDIIAEIRGEQINGLSTIGMYGSQWGYSAINFILMFLLGAYLKKGKPKIQNTKSWKLILCLLVDVVLIVIWALQNDKIGFLTERSAWEYCSPLVIASAVMIFVLFSRIDCGANRIINKLAEGSFSVFLLHQIFMKYLKIEKFVSGNFVVMICHIFGCAVIIYIVCWCVHFGYHLIVDPVFRFLSKKIDLQVIDADS